MYYRKVNSYEIVLNGGKDSTATPCQRENMKSHQKRIKQYRVYLCIVTRRFGVVSVFTLVPYYLYMSSNQILNSFSQTVQQ